MGFRKDSPETRFLTTHRLGTEGRLSGEAAHQSRRAKPLRTEERNRICDAAVERSNLAVLRGVAQSLNFDQFIVNQRFGPNGPAWSSAEAFRLSRLKIAVFSWFGRANRAYSHGF